MIIRIRIADWRFTLTFWQVTDVAGVNSLLKDGKHILMWDFDDTPLKTVLWTLKLIQHQFQLPKIRILNTGQINHYIAYCFKKCSWWNTRRIIASTPNICTNFFKWGIFRKRFTLRVTPKCNRKPKLVCTLPSKVNEDVAVWELTSWAKDTYHGWLSTSFPFPAIPTVFTDFCRHPPKIRSTPRQLQQKGV